MQKRKEISKNFYNGLYVFSFRPTRNAVYHTAYELMGLPIDPHCRNFQEMLRKGKHLSFSNYDTFLHFV